MAHVVFTQQLRRFIETPELDVEAGSLRDALDAVFAAHPRLRGYVLESRATCGRTWSPSSMACAATTASRWPMHCGRTAGST